MTDPARLRWLLRWAANAWELETPTLGHSVSLSDAGGVPALKAAAAAYIRLHNRRCWPLDAEVTLAMRDAHAACGRGGCVLGQDDWERTACRRDQDGFYVTPLRAAMTRIRPLEKRRFLHDLVSNARLRPSDIAELHGVPGWAEAPVIQNALETLHRECQAAPTPRRSYIDLSASQQNAEAAA